MKQAVCVVSKEGCSCNPVAWRTREKCMLGLMATPCRVGHTHTALRGLPLVLFRRVGWRYFRTATFTFTAGLLVVERERHTSNCVDVSIMCISGRALCHTPLAHPPKTTQCIMLTRLAQQP